MTMERRVLMDRRVKLIAVTAILVTGTATALMFRRHAPPAIGDPATAPEMLRRQAGAALPPLTPPDQSEIGRTIGNSPQGATTFGSTTLAGSEMVSPLEARTTVAAAPYVTAQKPDLLPARALDAVDNYSASKTSDPLPPAISPNYNAKTPGSTPSATLMAPAAGTGAAIDSLEPSAPPLRTHRVTDGDTLSRLATRYLGRADRYLEIYRANRDVLESPDLLPIGAELAIPPRVAAATDNISELSSAAGMLAPVGPLPPSAAPVATPAFAPVGMIANQRPMPRNGLVSATTLAPTPTPLPPVDRLPTTATGSLPTSAAPAQRPRTYTVQNNESLADIAMRLYNDPRRQTDLFLANRSRMNHPRDVRPGMVLNVP